MNGATRVLLAATPPRRPANGPRDVRRPRPPWGAAARSAEQGGHGAVAPQRKGFFRLALVAPAEPSRAKAGRWSQWSGRAAGPGSARRPRHWPSPPTALATDDGETKAYRKEYMSTRWPGPEEPREEAGRPSGTKTKGGSCDAATGPLTPPRWPRLAWTPCWPGLALAALVGPRVHLHCGLAISVMTAAALQGSAPWR